MLRRLVVTGAALAALVALGVPPAGAAEPAFFRQSGLDRYGTAAAVSSKAFPAGADNVFVASGTSFPDALAGASFAAADGGPILLVRRDALPNATAEELDRLNPKVVTVLGGTSAVSDRDRRGRRRVRERRGPARLGSRPVVHRREHLQRVRGPGRHRLRRQRPELPGCPHRRSRDRRHDRRTGAPRPARCDPVGHGARAHPAEADEHRRARRDGGGVEGRAGRPRRRTRPTLRSVAAATTATRPRCRWRTPSPPRRSSTSRGATSSPTPWPRARRPGSARVRSCWSRTTASRSRSTSPSSASARPRSSCSEAPPR